MKVFPLSIALVAVMFALSTLAQEVNLSPAPAAPSPIADKALMHESSWAGNRIVAVGDHGMVLLSDDQGGSFRQASTVPVSSPLTAVSFADADKGWAVGHWGAVLATADGGESWNIQRLATDEDRPLFDVYFLNDQEGVAVGLWSLLLTTRDGGQTWTEQQLQAPPGARRADLNLIGLFADGQGRVYATAERGQVLRSADKGQTWEYLDTGYDGTLWTGVALPDGRLLVGGQSGTLLLGTADGHSWQRIPLNTRSSITSIVVDADQVDVVGLDGFFATGNTRRLNFTSQPVADGVAFTSIIHADKRVLLFSTRGVISATAALAAMSGN